MNKKKTMLGLGIAVVLVAVMVAVWVFFGAKPTEGNKKTGEGDRQVASSESVDGNQQADGDESAEGSKSITIEVVDSKKKSVTYELQTDAEYLKEAMEEVEELSFKMESGMVIVINGERAVWSEDGSYWSIYVNGEYGLHGIDTQIVEDGDAFKFEYTK